MKSVVRTQYLRDSLKIAGQVVIKRSTMPILAHVLIEATQTQIKISATDLENYLTTELEALTTDANEVKRVAVPFTDLDAIAKAAGKNTPEIEITITDEDKGRAVVKVGRGEYELKG